MRPAIVLTPRRYVVAAMVRAGLDTGEIAAALGITRGHVLRTIRALRIAFDDRAKCPPDNTLERLRWAILAVDPATVTTTAGECPDVETAPAVFDLPAGYFAGQDHPGADRVGQRVMIRVPCA